jgi:uncharacterized membrane protein
MWVDVGEWVGISTCVCVCVCVLVCVYMRMCVRTCAGHAVVQASWTGTTREPCAGQCCD